MAYGLNASSCDPLNQNCFLLFEKWLNRIHCPSKQNTVMIWNLRDSQLEKSNNIIYKKHSSTHCCLKKTITIYYNQGEKLLDRLSLLSSIHPITALKWSFCPLRGGIVILNPCLKIEFPFPTPCLNVALNSSIHASIVWINTENGEWGKSPVNMPE